MPGFRDTFKLWQVIRNLNDIFDGGTVGQTLLKASSTDFDFDWGGNAEVAYGEMHINGNSTATTVTVSDTWYQITAGWVTGDVSNTTFSTDELQCDLTGEYLISVSVSMTGFANDTFSIAIAKNDTTDAATLIERKTSSADVGALSLNAMISLTDTDSLQLYGKNQAGTNNLTITECTFTMVKVG